MGLFNNLIKDKVLAHRKLWEDISNDYINHIREDEVQLARLKAENRSKGLIQTLDTKLYTRIEFYNTTEKYIDVLFNEAVNHNSKKMLIESAYQSLYEDLIRDFREINRSR
jgi:hypothetical protein